MPALPDVPQVLKAVHTGTQDGEPWATISHWRYVMSGGGAPSSTQLAVACAKFVNSWRDNIRPFIGADAFDDQVELIDLTTVSSATGVAPDGDAGAGGPHTFDLRACILVTKKIARRYRGGHPRTYWPGVAGSQLLDGGRNVDPAVLAGLQAGFTAYYTDIPPAITTDGATGMSSFHEVNVSYHSGGVLRAVPVVDDILGYVVQAQTATQRRRLHRS